MGVELALTATWRIRSDTTAALGFRRLSAGAVIESTGPAATVNFVYAQLLYDF